MSPNPVLELLDYPETDEQTIKQKARDGNAKLIAAGAIAGNVVAGPAGAAAGAGAAYLGLVDEEDLDRVLTLIRRLSTGDWRKVESLAVAWQNAIEKPTGIAEDLRKANLTLDRYWNGAAYDAFNRYLTDALLKIEATSDKIADMSGNLANLIVHVSTATGDMIRAIGKCADTLLSNWNPLSWPGIIGGFISTVTDLIDSAITRFAELRKEAVRVGNSAAQLKQIGELPATTVYDGTESGGGLSGWQVQPT